MCVCEEECLLHLCGVGGVGLVRSVTRLFVVRRADGRPFMVRGR